ncbi:MAG: glycosyltransferase family 1 protein [Bacteroidales bacterium]|nr:glycosyltransferase family 1 protein [Bacteroidales bacterium]
MPEKHLHIVSFDVPFPPNYGGVIDVYFKLVALKKAGVKIHLHCFSYGREPAHDLDQWCEEVHYYPRKTGFINSLGLRPYIVQSRQSEALIQRLAKDNYPILFEGLHSCFYIDDARLKGRKKIYRESNIEHHYYFHLFRAERNFFRKFYFISASLKLRLYQNILKHATMMLVVSKSDTEYLQKQFKSQRVIYLPSFHPNDEFSVIQGKGDYALYHGKLSVTENHQAARYLIEKVFSVLDHRLVIAGLEPPEHLIKLIRSHPNVELVANPDDEAMFDLIRNAQANVLVTFQPTGLKLKLLNTLYQGRFCLVNPEMVVGTGLDSLCEIAGDTEELKEKVHLVFDRAFDFDEVERRRKILDANYANSAKAEKLIELVFGSD